MKTIFAVRTVLRLGRLRIVSCAAILMAAVTVHAADPVVFDNRANFIAALHGTPAQTQNFNGFSFGTDLNGATLVPGVTVSSTFGTLTLWTDGSLFGYDGTTRANGQGAYSFNLTGYNAAGFDILSWHPASPGPAMAIIRLNDGTSHRIERRQTGTSESSPVFFGVIADQPIVGIEWRESPEIGGWGNEEVSLDNFVCANVGASNPSSPSIIGTWEPDRYTGHAARLVVSQAGAGWLIRGYGACSPSFCVWGEVPLRRIQPFNEGAFDGWFATWEFSFKKTHLWLHFEGQSLVVQSMDIFSADDGRAPYSMLSRMHAVNGLSINRCDSGSALAVKIPAGSALKLQHCADLNGAKWVDVPLPAGTAEHVIPPASKQGFFRLVPVTSD